MNKNIFRILFANTDYFINDNLHCFIKGRQDKVVSNGLRIYYTKTNDTIILLLTGGNKTRQDKDIKPAQEYLNEFRYNKTGHLPGFIAYYIFFIC